MEKRRGAASLIGWYPLTREERRGESSLMVLDVFVRANVDGGGDGGGGDGKERIAVGRSSSSPSELAV